MKTEQTYICECGNDSGIVRGIPNACEILGNMGWTAIFCNSDKGIPYTAGECPDCRKARIEKAKIERRPLAEQMANNLLCGLSINEVFGDLFEGPGLTDYMCAIGDCQKILENRGKHEIANEVHMYLYRQGKRLSLGE